LAEPGVAYLVLAPGGSDFEVDLMEGDGPLSVEWHNPVNGEVSVAEDVRGAAKQTFRPPFDGPAVLFLKAASAHSDEFNHGHFDAPSDNDVM
jgi:hypothetical protein